MSGTNKSIAVKPGEIEAAGESTYPSVFYIRCGADRDLGPDHNDSPALVDGLTAENWQVGYYNAPACLSHSPDQPLLATLTDRFRNKFAFLKQLVRNIPKHDLVHIEVSGHTVLGTRAIARLALPALVLAKFFGKPTVLHFATAEAETFLEKQGSWFRPILKAADQIVVGSRYLQKALGHADLDSSRIAAACDTKGFSHRTIRDLQPRVLINCPLERPYNVSCALKAFMLVKQKYPRAELQIVGEGSRFSVLQTYVQRHNTWGVDFLGWQTTQQFQELASGCDLFLHSASVDESPTAFVQAFAAGLPVVTTDADGLLHMVRDRHNALIATVGDHVGLADRMIELIEDPDLTEKLSKRGKREADKYAWSRVRQDWVNLYTGLTA